VQTDDSEWPLVSVVIPAFNAAATLDETLASVLAQSWPRLEIIVVDDGSRDDTAAVLARHAPRVRAIRRDNGGLAAARNTGLRAATGDFIALLDADDLCAPERLGAQVAVMRRRPDVVLSATEFSLFDESGTLSPRHARQYYSRLGAAAAGPATFFPERLEVDVGPWLPGAAAGGVTMAVQVGDVSLPLALGNFVHPPTVLFRRELLAAAGLFDETIRNCCDWEWLVRAARVGKFAFIDRPLLRYRRSPSQMSGPRHKLQLYSDVLDNLRRFARDDPRLLQEQGRAWRRSVGRASVDLASALVETDRLRALRLLAQAASCGVVSLGWARHLAKAMIPGIVVRRIRARRAEAGSRG